MKQAEESGQFMYMLPDASTEDEEMTDAQTDAPSKTPTDSVSEQFFCISFMLLLKLQLLFSL